jgi:hypothetical protein
MAAQARTNVLARCMKAIGYLTDPATTPGKVFTWWERETTAAMERLARNDLYLDAAGKTMEQAFRVQAMSVKAMDRALGAARVPTVGSLAELSDEVRRLGDQIEDMNARLERVMDRLDRLDRRAAGAAS